MRRYRLYGVIAAAWAEQVQARLRAARLPASIIPNGATAAIFGPCAPLARNPLALFKTRPDPLVFRQVLETAVEISPLMPAFERGAPLPKAQLSKILRQYADSLADALNEYGSFVQYDVVARWDLDAITAQVEKDGMLPRRLELPSGPLMEAHKRDVSDALSTEIAARRRLLGGRFIDALKPVLFEFAPLTIDTSTMVGGVTAIVRRSDIAKLDASLRKLRRETNLDVECAGPLPPLALAGLELIDSEKSRLANARRMFSLPERPARGDIKAAYYRALKERHPSLRRGGRVNAGLVTRLHTAYEVLMAAADSQDARAPSSIVDLSGADATRYAMRLRRLKPPKTPKESDDGDRFGSDTAAA